MQQKADDLLAKIVEIVSDYIRKNAIPRADIDKLAFDIRQTLSSLSGESSDYSFANGVKSAVPVSESITPDYIICLDDGKRFKSLKRHLRAQYDLSPEQYRERWGLSADYPMMAPNYAKERSRIAKRSWVGKHNGLSDKVAIWWPLFICCLPLLEP